MAGSYSYSTPYKIDRYSLLMSEMPHTPSHSSLTLTLEHMSVISSLLSLRLTYLLFTILIQLNSDVKDSLS